MDNLANKSNPIKKLSKSVTGNSLNILVANCGFSGNIDLSPSTVKETPGFPGLIEVILLNF